MDFIFIYKYNNKLRTSRNFQYEDGFNIKINRVIKIPQSYYNDQMEIDLIMSFFEIIILKICLNI